MVWEPFQTHNQFIVGLGAAFQMTDRLSAHLDYTVNLSPHKASVYYDPFTIGIDYVSGRNVFQILFGNALGYNDPSYMTNAAGAWNEADIHIGLYLGRIF